MTPRIALALVLAVALGGAAFSGFLSYQELTGVVDETCPAPGAPGTILGYPACVYGLVMYVVVATAALWGLLADRGSRRAS